MYDKKNNVYTEDFLKDVDDSPFQWNIVPWMNSPQINQDISIES